MRIGVTVKADIEEIHIVNVEGGRVNIGMTSVRRVRRAGADKDFQGSNRGATSAMKTAERSVTND